ncbi:MAG TPA: alpha/beta hydrolase [Pseudolysinimonas sp.]|nr:alpha/beta hydrolase [Pseudolysinimonas sp.]
MTRVVLGDAWAALGDGITRIVLLDVTAVLSASATLNSVAEAFSVPAASPVAIVAPAAPSAEQAAWAAATQPQQNAQPQQDTQPQVDQPADPQASRALTQLDDLASFSRAQLASWASDPSAIADLLATQPAAAEVADWWSSTDASARTRLTAAVPEVVGNLEGVPYAVRDSANRLFLDSQLSSIQRRLTDGSAGRAATEQLQAQLHMLQQVDAALETGESGLTRSLLNLDVAGGGRAVIAVGDLSSADYVSFLVPGMFYSVDSEIGSWADAADQLAVDQSRWLSMLTPAQHSGPAQTVATVAWIGYQTPSVVNVASLDLAREGRDALTRSLRGLDATRPASAGAPYVSVLAHSYGATAALLALQENDVTVDALAMVGSPGSPAGNVGQLRVRNGNVWVADAALDPIASTGVFGSQPLSAEYGAHHFGVGGARDPLTGRELAGSVGHVDYFTAGSESFRNMALIGIGQGRLVLDASGATAAAPRALAG